MNCAIFMLGIIAPRVLVAFWWIADPARWGATFNTAFVPVIGFLFLPWTTIMYVLFWSNGGLTLGGWLAVGLGLLLDLGTYGGGALVTPEEGASDFGDA